MDIEKMHELYRSGQTLKEVGIEFGVTAQYVAALFKKHGLSTRSKPKTRKMQSKIKGLSYAWESKKESWVKLDSKIKGEIAENHVKNRLLELGFEMWVSVTPNSKSDMAVLNPVTGRLVKIQVKCATYVESDKRFRVAIVTKDKNRQPLKYLSEDVDYFIVYCPFVFAFYVIPFEATIHTNHLNLVPHRERFKIKNEAIYEGYLEAFHLLCK